MDIPISEFTRRLCEKAHPYLGTTGAVVPCGPHTQIARSLYFLTKPEGAYAREVIEEVVHEAVAEAPDAIEAVTDAAAAV